jgi:hypothetical protein
LQLERDVADLARKSVPPSARSNGLAAPDRAGEGTALVAEQLVSRSPDGIEAR